MNKSSSNWSPKIALALLGLIFGFLLVQVMRAAYDTGGYDLSGYLVAAQDMLHGQDPYTGHELPHAIEGLEITPHAFIYPLFAALLFLPLTLLPYALTNVLWFVISAASLLLIWRLLLGLLEGLPKAAGLVPFALPALLLVLVLFSPLQNNFVNGQINLMVVACCVLFLHYFVKNRPVLSAFWLATAIMIKLLPIMLVLFLLIRKQYRMIIYTGAFAVLFLLLPGLVVGDKLLDFNLSYVHSFLSAKLLGTEVDHARPLLSLQGVVACFSPALGLAGGTKIISMLFALAAIIGVELATARMASPAREIWAFGAYLVGALLISPMPEKHHMVLIIPPCALIGLKLYGDPSWRSKTRLSLVAAFLVCFVVLPRFLHHSPAEFIALLLLLVLMGLAARQDASDAAPPPPGASAS